MKRTDHFGPWSMSAANECRLSAFWKRRFDALRSGCRPQTTRGQWIGLGLLSAILVSMPTWHIGEGTAEAQEGQATAVPAAPALPRSANAVRSNIATPTSAPGPVPGFRRQWQLVDSPSLPAASNITMLPGQTRKLGLPKGCKVIATDLAGQTTAKAFTLKTVDKGDKAQYVTIRGVEPGVGRLACVREDRINAELEYKIVVLSDPAPLKAKLHKAGFESVTVTPGVQSVIVSGTVNTVAELGSCISMADDLYPHVVNNLHIRDQNQVFLECKVLEFTTDLKKTDAILGTLFKDGKPTSHAKGIYSSLMKTDGLEESMERLKKLSAEVQVLAEPALTTVSGRPAAFNAGGEFPILIPQGQGTVAVEYKQFGTRVDIVPVVINEQTIRINVRPQVSHLMTDKEHSVVIDGKRVPGLSSRWVDAKAEMTPEQTMVVVMLYEDKDGKRKGIVTMVRPSFVDGTDALALPARFAHPAVLPSERTPSVGEVPKPGYSR